MEENWSEAYDVFQKLDDTWTTESRVLNELKTLDDIKAEIRIDLERNGTNVQLNDEDLTGDGDQSQVNKSSRDYYQELFATGADLFHHKRDSKTLSKFVICCITGQTDLVREMLRQVDSPGKPPEQLINLLETRETSLRCSPLLMILAMEKQLDPQCHEGQRKNVELLLSYGARPDAKDVVGKTVCHYGSGEKATETSLAMVDMCIPAAESAFLFAKRVELFGLNNYDMNGKIGIARGFHVKSGRRAVYLLQDRKEVAVKPQNLRVLGDLQEAPPATKLCDIIDRISCVCLYGVVLHDRFSTWPSFSSRSTKPRLILRTWMDIHL